MQSTFWSTFSIIKVNILNVDKNVGYLFDATLGI